MPGYACVAFQSIWPISGGTGRLLGDHLDVCRACLCLDACAIIARFLLKLWTSAKWMWRQDGVLQSKLEVPDRLKDVLCAAGHAVGGRRFRYLFYVDFVGNLADDLPQNALRHLQEVTEFMRVLGCYPMHVEAAQS